MVNPIRNKHNTNLVHVCMVYRKTGNSGVTLVKSDSKNFDERSVDKLLVKVHVLFCINYLKMLILLSGFTLKG